MIAHKVSRLALLASSWLAVSACAAAPSDSEAPAATLDDLDEADEGSTYGDWYHYIGGAYSAETSTVTFSHTFVRSSGVTSRGGGACLVHQAATSCSSDSTCISEAVSWYGAGAYGYCYTGTCYYRPGTAPTHCSQSSNRSEAGGNMTVTKGPYTVANRTYHALGCMTKAAGPSPDCGSTNSSLYMRVLHYLDYNTPDPCGGYWCGDVCC